MSEHSITTTPSTPRSIELQLLRIAWLGCLVVVLLQVVVPGTSRADDDPLRVVAVADPFLEMHTGPGRGYPVFHAVDRGESISIVKQRTEWYQVRTDRDIEGWVHQSQMELTLNPDGSEVDFEQAGLEDFTNAKWEAGMLAGDFGGANVMSVYGSYSLNPNIAIEAWGSQVLGNSSNSYMGSINIVHEAFPEWRVSPFFTLGAGVIHTKPKTTIVRAEDRTDQIGHVGAGFRIYATRRFLLRAEYKSYVIFTSRNDNEEIEEWKAGFAFFF